MKLLGQLERPEELIKAAREVAKRAPLMQAGEVHKTTSAGAVGWSPVWPQRFVPMFRGAAWPEIPAQMHELAAKAMKRLSAEHVSIDWLEHEGALTLRPQGRVWAPSLLVVLGCGATVQVGEEWTQVSLGQVYSLDPGDQVKSVADLRRGDGGQGYLHLWMRQLWPKGRA